MKLLTDGRTTDYVRTPEHGYTISSPCEPNGSGELINRTNRHILQDDKPVHLSSPASLMADRCLHLTKVAGMCLCLMMAEMYHKCFS